MVWGIGKLVSTASLAILSHSYFGSGLPALFLLLLQPWSVHNDPAHTQLTSCPFSAQNPLLAPSCSEMPSYQLALVCPKYLEAFVGSA